MNRLSVCAETIFQDLPFADRARQIAAAGYLVEFWRRDLSDIVELERTIHLDPQIRIVNFSGAFEGSFMHPDGTRAYLDGVKARLPVARRLRCKQLMLITGELDSTGAAVHPISASLATRRRTAYRTLCEIAEIAEKNDLAYNLENLNSVHDHPGYPLPRVEEVVELLDRVGSPRIRLLLDVYHARMQGEDIASTIIKYAPFIGHIHVADAPGRHEPGTGGIDWARVTAALDQIHYQGIVGLEAWPASSDSQALQQFGAAFGRTQRTRPA